ncbi:MULTISPECIES: hypothetical protein [Cysteiniphilum]|uniref:Uncharacterized protein n=1 Tax=Cysteiniphilum litorale TaxID=2056700 RepID=A0A8J2Z6N5_9GAMM|nr:MULTISPECIES: hypothetical protein [Cysteiniphilum]GGG06926.1 hypothetical protein GCM10010995_25540 [Cysteiniphilum litorale]
MKHKHQGQLLALRTSKILLSDHAEIEKTKNDEPTQANTYEKMLNIKNIKTQPISITPYLRRLCI